MNLKASQYKLHTWKQKEKNQMKKKKKKQNKKPNTEERIQKLYSNICAIRIPKEKERMRTG